ncbi:Uncharacterised protein [Salmonella enterica subsp. enterica serovar Typhi]|nr:Uncharacterised protein [Salmonella enterica subsp. enterica serovar Typhi]
MLRPCPVEVTLTATFLAGNFLAFAIHRRQNCGIKWRFPASRRTKYPLHFLIATDFDNRTLVAEADDDGIIFTVIVDAVDMRPVAASPTTHDIPEFVGGVQRRQIFFAQRMAGLAGVDIQAHCALIEGFHYHITIRIEDIKQTPFIHYHAVLINFGNHITHGTNIFPIRTFIVRAGYTQEVVTVGRVIH